MRRFFIAFLLIVLIPTETFASVIFQSLFPNPLGDDTLGEYIEIRNTGCSSIDISHYSLSDASGKTYTLPNSTIIDASNSRKFPYSETKIALNNTGNEGVYLKDPSNTLLDSYEYSGTQKDNVVITISFTDDSCTEEIIITSSGSIEASGSTETPVSTGSTSSGTADTFTGVIIHSSGSTTATGEALTSSTSSGNTVTNTGSSNTAFTGITSSGTTEVYSASGSLSGGIAQLENTGISASGASESIMLIENTGGTIGSGSIISENTLPPYTEIGLLLPLEMYYSDSDENGKIDTLEISYPYTLTGSVNMGAISLYSNTGGLASSRINTMTGYISSSMLSGNILILKVMERDIEKELLKVNNTISSDLRLKSSGDLGFRSLGSKIPEPFFLTTSFSEYKKVYRKSPNTIILESATGTGEVSQSGLNIVEVSTGSTNTGDIAMGNTGVSFPVIIPTLQSPTNAILSGDTFTCTTSDCRINLTLEPIFLSGFTMKDYTCYFGTGDTLIIDSDCNPNTLYFTASGNLIIELVSKQYREQKSRKIYSIEWRVSYSNSSFVQVPIISGISIDTGNPMARIEVDGKWKEYYEQIGDYEMNCYTFTCSVNFTAENSSDPEGSPIRWLWIYGPNDISTSRDPGTKKYGIGDHKIILRVIDSSGNYDEIEYLIHVLGPKPKGQKIQEIKTSRAKKIETVIAAATINKKRLKKIKMIFFSAPEIILQGRSGEESAPLSYTCKYKKNPFCNLNFTLLGTLRGYEYRWTLDGEEIYTGKNPSSWKLPSGLHEGIVSSYYKGEDTAIHTSKFSIQITAEPKKLKKPKKAKQKKLTSKVKKSPTLIPEANAESENSHETSSPLGSIGFVLFMSGAILGYFLRRRRKL